MTVDCLLNYGRKGGISKSMIATFVYPENCLEFNYTIIKNDCRALVRLAIGLFKLVHYENIFRCCPSLDASLRVWTYIPSE